jgi:bifunctional enzyme CysN/CysC
MSKKTNPSSLAVVAERGRSAQQAGSSRELMKIVIVGHVDHGKSTLVGRLLHDSGSLPDGKYEAIKTMCERRGMPFEWAFLMDALQAERDQGITIDTSQIWFKTAKRDYVIIDAPGHTEFLKNMITGAAASDAAVLVIDVAEGVKEQSRRHGYLLHMLGVRNVVVVCNKMDLIGFDRDRFRAVEQEYRAYLASIGVTPTFVIPISARGGDNMATRSTAMPWYEGPILVEALDAFRPAASLSDLPLRFAVQDVYKFDDRRIIAGRIETGVLRVGDTVMFSPANKTAKVRTIEAWSAPVQVEAKAGQSVGITLTEQIFVERGDMVSHVENAPIETDVFRAQVFWLGHDPLTAGKAYKVKLGTSEVPVVVQSVERVVNTSDLSRKEVAQVERNEVGEVVLRAKRLLALDEFRTSQRTGRFVIIDKYDIVGGGIISIEGYADQRELVTVRATNIVKVEHRVTASERFRRNGHRGAVLWLTGLSGAGKSTLAVELEQRLFAKGYHVYVLDGDNVRSGLNANLSFSPEDRAENIRRVGEVAALFADAGMIVLTAFISPYQSDRARARRAAGEAFHEVYVAADLATCEQRDPKGLYKKARSGAIADFTGISAPYEAPDKPELVVNTGSSSIDASVEQVLDYINTHIARN